MDQLISDTIGKALNVRLRNFPLVVQLLLNAQKLKFDNVVRMGLKLHPSLVLKLGGS